MTLRLYNTRTRQKEIFIPENEGEPDFSIGVYVCGPTVYDLAHVGNARPVVVFDVLVTLLRSLFARVKYVQNITDVDDKITASALEKGISIAELTSVTSREYFQDMAALGASRPDISPRATDHIPHMIEMIELLIQKGHAYENEGHVLFHVPSYAQYGKLSLKNQEELLAGARVEVAPYKKSPADFVLWKPSSSDLPGWESPWGRGRPGWHIECSAMATTYLGKTFDIHGGGIDLVFPHHENEVAQSCCAYDCSYFAKYWLHNGHLTVNGEKMSKSLGNFYTVRDLLAKYPGEVIRYMLLSSHYRQPLDLTDNLLFQCRQSLNRIYGALRGLSLPLNFPKSTLENCYSPAVEALLDDLNSPLALKEIHELVSQINKEPDYEKKQSLAYLLKRSAALLGLGQQDPEKWFQGEEEGITSEEIEVLINRRHQCRQEKNFAGADQIRQDLLSKGILLEDTPSGTKWQRLS